MVMKFIMCILFFPVFLVKQVFALTLSMLLFVLLAFSMAFGADGKVTKEYVAALQKWANKYPPADL